MSLCQHDAGTEKYQRNRSRQMLRSDWIATNSTIIKLFQVLGFIKWYFTKWSYFTFCIFRSRMSNAIHSCMVNCYIKNCCISFSNLQPNISLYHHASQSYVMQHLRCWLFGMRILKQGLGVEREPFMLRIIPEAIIDRISFVHRFHMAAMIGICNIFSGYSCTNDILDCHPYNE